MHLERYWLALSRSPFIGYKTIHRALDFFKSIEKIFLGTIAELRLAGFNEKQINSIRNINWKSVDEDFAWIEKNKIQIITQVDLCYPPLLKEIHDPPFILYVKGNANLLSSPQIAMVGTRNPTPSGKELAYQFAKELANAGLVITSGMALGIDGASHSGALDSGKLGQTIAVLGTGLKYIYPKNHQRLAHEIIEKEGAILSEFPINTPPKPHNFPIRNRIISGLSLGLLVVEAALKSGSLITARLSLEQNRDVFAIPGSIQNPLSRGCHRLISEGAKLVENVQDILLELKFRSHGQPNIFPISRQEPVDLDPTRERVLKQIGYEVTALDVIILRSGLTPMEVSSMLLPLELEGYIQGVPGGFIRRSQ